MCVRARGEIHARQDRAGIFDLRAEMGASGVNVETWHGIFATLDDCWRSLLQKADSV